jgi:surface antigen
MTMKTLMMAAAALCAIGTVSALAQPYQDGPRDPNGYFNQSDQTGYYDRDGNYRRFDFYRGARDDGPRDNGPPPGAYYEQGRYEQNCHQGNQAAGTIFGAVAGGLIGGAVSHGNGGAVVGGAVLGGLLGNTVSKDIDCDDQPYAFRVYSDGLNGDLNRRYDWNHGQARGYFVPTSEFRRGGLVCRNFSEVTYRGDRQIAHTGTACRAQDGNWRFD